MVPLELLLVQAASAWFLTGLIWVIQLVHYPLMARVGEAGWVGYQHAHMRRITWIVAPAMLTEAVSAALCLRLVINGLDTDPGSGGSVAWHAVLVGLLVVIWGSTWLLQVPAHTRLTRGFDGRAHRRLVQTNWIRTAAWSTRAVILALMIGALSTT